MFGYNFEGIKDKISKKSSSPKTLKSSVFTRGSKRESSEVVGFFIGLFFGHSRAHVMDALAAIAASLSSIGLAKFLEDFANSG